MKRKLFVTALVMSAALSAPCLNRALAADAQSQSHAELQAQAKVSEAKAREIALKKVPGGMIQASELEEEHGHLIWSFDISNTVNRNITEVQVDANDGTIVAVTIETPNDQAKESAADKNGG